MKKILLAYLILCLCLNKISCTTKNNSEEKTLYFREHYGEMGWNTTGKEEKHGKYIGDIKKNKPHGQGKYTYYKNPEDSEYQLSLLIPEMPKIIVFVITLWQMLNQGKEENLAAQYIGKWNRGKKHGKGTYFFPNGDKYFGRLTREIFRGVAPSLPSATQTKTHDWLRPPLGSVPGLADGRLHARS